ncbi:MAG: hypothetical protein NTZ17_05280 [Phycisphaerae bacterium]|nr:hypothetical protein [Phycisphaerae bacterium]
MAMTEWVAIGISGFALVVSSVTAWLTLLQTGDLRMTQPTVVFFGPDGGRRDDEKPRLKVFLRTLLYSTSRRGQTIESMHVNLQRAESRQNFSIWVYGDDRLARRSGLHVGADGVACNHHFLLPEDGADFRLLPGQYTVRVFAKRVADRGPRQLALVALSISESQAKELEQDDAGIYFDWGPDQEAYHAHVEIRKPGPIPPWLLEATA